MPRFSWESPINKAEASIKVAKGPCIGIEGQRTKEMQMHSTSWESPIKKAEASTSDAAPPPDVVASFMFGSFGPGADADPPRAPQPPFLRDPLTRTPCASPGFPASFYPNGSVALRNARTRTRTNTLPIAVGTRGKRRRLSPKTSARACAVWCGVMQ